ncbi:hypothetical protein niasHT_009605 [Heterodera trifolii]|uniref:non-specific serine/threonine protein kinase n=1 Tax=Heterodera trifolii TaxID=157864 RepID=A0ABD2LU34_9BILA
MLNHIYNINTITAGATAQPRKRGTTGTSKHGTMPAPTTTKASGCSERGGGMQHHQQFTNGRQVTTGQRRKGATGNEARSQPPLLPPLTSVYDFKDVVGIGSGAFANVFRARELIAAAPAERYRHVALKRINLSAIEKENQLMYQSVLNEVDIFKSLSHANIVKCFYSFTEVSPHSGVKYLVLVLEYVNGGDLETWLQKSTNDCRVLLPEADLWRVFAQIADAVRYIHTKNIIHRDLKPPNVLMKKNNQAKLTDFGLSRQQDGGSRANTVCGTPYYMSPERIRELVYTAKSDVWSLGCILYEMATLRSPFFGEKSNITSLTQKISDAEYPPLPDDSYSQPVTALIQYCLRPNAEERPTAAQVHRMAALMAKRWEGTPPY